MMFSRLFSIFVKLGATIFVKKDIKSVSFFVLAFFSDSSDSFSSISLGITELAGKAFGVYPTSPRDLDFFLLGETKSFTLFFLLSLTFFTSSLRAADLSSPAPPVFNSMVAIASFRALRYPSSVEMSSRSKPNSRSIPIGSTIGPLFCLFFFLFQMLFQKSHINITFPRDHIFDLRQ